LNKVKEEKSEEEVMYLENIHVWSSPWQHVSKMYRRYTC